LAIDNAYVREKTKKEGEFYFLWLKKEKRQKRQIEKKV